MFQWQWKKILNAKVENLLGIFHFIYLIHYLIFTDNKMYSDRAFSLEYSEDPNLILKQVE